MKLRVGVTEAVVERWGERMASAAPGAEIVVLGSDGKWRGEPAGLDGFFLSEDLYVLMKAMGELADVVRRAPPRWLQTASTGVDFSIYADLLASGSVLTNAPGAHGGPIAEYVFAHMLGHAKRMEEHRTQMRRREWRRLQSMELAGQTIGIVGYGGIGAAIASRARAFEMRTMGTKRSAAVDGGPDVRLVPERLSDLLAESDYVVLCVPLTDATVELIGAQELAVMQAEALLINVARGRVVDHAALAASLRAGEIGGAVLDVTPEEPLSAESPLWELPNCLITPHDACYVEASFERTTEFFLENLGRLARGEPLKWVVADMELSVPTPLPSSPPS